MDSVGALWIFAHYKSWISQLAVRPIGNCCGFILWLDVAENWVHLRFGPGTRRGGCVVALYVSDRLRGSIATEQIASWLVNLVEQFAAVSKPPTENQDRNGCGEGPPKRQKQISQKADPGKGHPEDFALHGSSLLRMTTGNRMCGNCEPSAIEGGKRE